MRTDWRFFGSGGSSWWEGGCLIGAVQVTQAGALVCVKGREQKTLYSRQGVKEFWHSFSFLEKSCGAAGVISELHLSLPQCFTSHCPLESAQHPI